MSVLTALLSLAAEALLGYPDRLYRAVGHPVTWLGAVIDWADKGWNREGDSFVKRRFFGVLTCLGVTALAAFVAQILVWALPEGLWGAVLTGVERDADYAALARANAVLNGVAMQVWQADLAQMPGDLRAQSFDHVIMNPPYFATGTPSGDAARADARHEQTPLAAWLDAGLRRLRPGGQITIIHLAERLDSILAGLVPRAGAVTILPIAARDGRDAGRVIVQARKGVRTPLRLLSPFVMHQGRAHERDAENLNEKAQAILRHGAALDLKSPD